MQRGCCSLTPFMITERWLCQILVKLQFHSPRNPWFLLNTKSLSCHQPFNQLDRNLSTIKLRLLWAQWKPGGPSPGLYSSERKAWRVDEQDHMKDPVAVWDFSCDWEPWGSHYVNIPGAASLRCRAVPSFAQSFYFKEVNEYGCSSHSGHWSHEPFNKIIIVSWPLLCV